MLRDDFLERINRVIRGFAVFIQTGAKSGGRIKVQAHYEPMIRVSCKEGYEVKRQITGKIDGRLGLRLRGYHPGKPRPLRYRPFVHCL
jgi:hypothetical protein